VTGLPELVCPMCRLPLVNDPQGWHCTVCGRVFPIVAGIPDLRIAGDAYLSIEDDRRKAEDLAAVEGDFAAVLAAYWRWTPEVPADLAAHYVRSALDGRRRAALHLRRLGTRSGSLLDVGCGTGGLLAAASAAGAEPVGVDIALRWLVVASRALAEVGAPARLVAADGALLPFRAGSFDTVVCVETLEHAEDQRGLLHSCMAAARPGGVAYLVTANRHSLAPEPTVGLWGVGWLPRRAAVEYVRLRRGTRYRHFRPPSLSELLALLGPAPDARVTAAGLPAPPLGASPMRRRVGLAYDGIRRGRSQRVVRRVAPYLEVLSARAPAEPG